MSKNKSNILLNHNGKIIHEDIEVISSTRATLWEVENQPARYRCKAITDGWRIEI